MRKRLLFIAVFTILIISIFTGCHGEGIQKNLKEGEKPVVYASFFPICDMVKQVAGDTVTVKTFMPINTDPHMWQPTSKDMKELSKADILFINGANMENWVDQVRENLPNLKIVNLSEKVKLISYKGASELGDFQYMAKMNAKKKDKYEFSFGHTHEDVMRVCFVRNDENLKFDDLVSKTKNEMKKRGKLIKQKETIKVTEGEVYALEMGHESGHVYFKFPKGGEWYVVSDRISERILSYKIMLGDDEFPLKVLMDHSTSNKDKITYDPHSWLSLKNAKVYMNTIYDVLVENYGNQSYYKKNKFKAVDTLTSMNAEYREKFHKLKRKEFLTTHYAWEYLAQDFDLLQYPLQGLISTETPSLKTIKKAIDYCKKKEISTIFYEDNMPPKSAKTLAEEVGAGTKTLNSMEYIKEEEYEEAGAYTKIMQENLEKIYQSLAE